MHRFIDLFCGIGGFRVALAREGMDCVFSCDIDTKAQDAYEANFGDTPHGDIRTIQAGHIPEHDILCAGFPCQPFSLAGKRGSMADERGRLFYEIVRIAKHHRPLVLLLENVKNILTIDNGKAMCEIYRSIEGIGYRLQHYPLNASLFGVPQHRERVYFVALRGDCPLQHSTPKPNYRKCNLEDILLDDNSVPSSLVVNRDDMVLQDVAVEPSLSPIQIGYVNKGGQGERIYSSLGHAITQSASGGGVGRRTGLYLVNGKVRRLHIDEAKAVMGFAKQHQVSDGLTGHSQLGNAVIPSMINTIYESVRLP